MEDFIVKYYLVIMLVVAFILFALIGYLADNLKKKQAQEKETGNEDLPIDVANVTVPAASTETPEVIDIPETLVPEEPLTETEVVLTPEVEETVVAPVVEELVQEIPVETNAVTSNELLDVMIPEVEDEEDNK